MNVIEEKYNWAYPLTRRARTTLLVLHHEAGSGSTAQDIHRYTRGGAGIAYFVGLTGALDSGGALSGFGAVPACVIY